MSEENNRDQQINQYRKRRHIIHEKYPDIQKAPKTIFEEFFCLCDLLNGLENGSKVWGMEESTDGYQIDGFYLAGYENALARIGNLESENSEFITQEDMQKAEFYQINYDELRQEMSEIIDYKTLQNFRNKVNALYKNLISIEDVRKLGEISWEATRNLYEEKEAPEVHKQENEVTGKPEVVSMPVVKETKFEKIYNSAKGKIQGMVSAIKNRLGLKNREKQEEQETAKDEERE